MIIKFGSRGPVVARLQGRLNAKGFGPIRQDGEFGAGTLGAVNQFQAAHALAVDGIVGPATWAELAAGGPAQETLVPVDVPDGDHPTLLALRFASDDLGAVEAPDGSNAGPAISHLVDGYGEHWQIPGQGRYPWCAIAASVWIGQALGLGDRGDEMDWQAHPFGNWLGGVAAIEDWAREQGRWRTDFDLAPAGALFLMARSGSSSDPSRVTRAGHCGLVVDVDGDRVNTVDANVANSVSRRTRRSGSLRGWVVWW